MKILAFTDVHDNKRMINEILRKVVDVDYLVCCGDITTFENEFEDVIKLFSKVNKKMIIIPGNHENYEDLKQLCVKYDFLINVHLRMFKIEKYVFFGYGTGGFSFTDYDLEEKMKKIKFEKEDKLIFITHGPPYGTKLDKLGSLGHRGSKTLTKFIEKFKPILCLSGHLHENFNKEDKLNDTLLINPGPIGRIIEI